MGLHQRSPASAHAPAASPPIVPSLLVVSPETSRMEQTSLLHEKVATAPAFFNYEASEKKKKHAIPRL
jgi:hypothetical protein